MALCLTKGAGLDSLVAVDQVEIRLVKLPTAPKGFIRLQPRGQGFHLGGLRRRASGVIR